MALPPDTAEDKISEGVMVEQGQVVVAFNELGELGFAWSSLFRLELKVRWSKAVSSPRQRGFEFVSLTLLPL